jgi:hypothetical protein
MIGQQMSNQGTALRTYSVFGHMVSDIDHQTLPTIAHILPNMKISLFLIASTLVAITMCFSPQSNKAIW